MGNIWIASWQHCDIAGKIIMVSLGVLSFYSWYILIEKVFFLKDVEKKNRLFEKNLKSGKVKNFTESPLNSVLEYGIELKQKTGLEQIDIYLQKAFLQVQSKLGKNITSLATIATIAPFLGLLGTVWGLLLSFMGISVVGSSSVKVVAAGVSEALITTVAGLIVAIPASVGYNYYRGRIINILDRMESVLPFIVNYLKHTE